MEPIIDARALTKMFGNQSALRSLDFAVYRGFGFLGPSGSGKTTKIEILTAQPLPTSGTAARIRAGRRPYDGSEALPTFVPYRHPDRQQHAVRPAVGYTPHFAAAMRTHDYGHGHGRVYRVACDEEGAPRPRDDDIREAGAHSFQ